jgi:hypothetical protein
VAMGKKKHINIEVTKVNDEITLVVRRPVDYIESAIDKIDSLNPNDFTRNKEGFIDSIDPKKLSPKILRRLKKYSHEVYNLIHKAKPEIRDITEEMHGLRNLQATPIKPTPFLSSFFRLR